MVLAPAEITALIDCRFRFCQFHVAWPLNFLSHQKSFHWRLGTVESGLNELPEAFFGHWFVFGRVAHQHVVSFILEIFSVAVEGVYQIFDSLDTELGDVALCRPFFYVLLRVRP